MVYNIKVIIFKYLCKLYNNTQFSGNNGDYILLSIFVILQCYSIVMVNLCGKQRSKIFVSI